MPVQLFTEAERARRNRFPDVIAYEDLVTFFTLSERDLRSIPYSRDPHNRLGSALQLCTLRFMGFVPDDLRSAPPDAVAFVAHQLAVAPDVLAAYGARAQTRQDHLLAVQTHLGYRKVGRDDVHTLADWLLARALEHDKPTLLYELACEKLRTAQLVRPGVTRLERLVAETRERAQEATFHQLAPILTDECQRCLDTLLAPDPARGMTPLAWLRRPAVSNSPKAIVGNLEKLTFLRAIGIEAWSLAALNPNRLTFLAQLARKSSAQALQRSPAVRRYPLLVAFLVHCLAAVTDEVIEMFDHCLADAYARAGKDLEDFRKAMAQATNEKVHLFRELARAVLDPAIADPHLRPAIYTRLTPAVLRRAADEADRLVRPLDDSYFDFFETRYGYLRQCTPTFLETVAFQAMQEPDPLLQAVAVLHQLNTTHRRMVPSDAPTDFVPLKWRPYVLAPDGRIDRHYYELCTLWELRGALRAGNVWVPQSRRYANPETYLIPPSKWPALWPEVCQQLHVPEDGAIRLEQRGRELVELLPRVDRILSPQGPVRMEKGRVVVWPLEAEERPPRVEHLEETITARLPLIDLPDLLIEVDQWTGFSHHLRHLNGREPRRPDFLPVLYASLLAQGCNFGFARMAQDGRVPPLDYDYLKALTPAAQRCYEIISYKLFAALKYEHPEAKLSYSEYCTFAAQQPYPDYTHVKKQMYKVHKPHLASGYLESVRYEATTDEDGRPDWMMAYVPGPKARAEYAAFNTRPRQRPAHPAAGPPPAAPAAVPAPSSSLAAATGPAAPSPAADDALTTQAYALVQSFHQRFHGTPDVTPSAKELTQARTLITRYGLDQARHLVDFSVTAAHETDYQPQTFGGILQYTARARAAYAQTQERAAAAERAREEQRRAQADEQLRQQYEAARAARLAQLRATTPPDVLAAIEEAAATHFDRDHTSPFGRDLLRRYAIDDAVAAYFQLPSFVEWQATEPHAPAPPCD